MLHIYNTLTQKKEPFVPLQPGKIGMYVCGVTVYDHCHLGHARVMVVFDMINRYLKHLDFQVNYVRNITDIDDKILQRAADNEEPYTSLTDRMIASMYHDLAALEIQPPSHQPRASHYIPQMLELIQILLNKNHAYLANNGDVFYATRSFKGKYGLLNQEDLQTLRKGARVAIDPEKHDPLDFVLWKQAKSNEPYWDSPWGPGRPGWHIECSAMALDHLGHSFDIHGGGLDLRFPHHHNEIAQAEAATGKKFVNFWMHVGQLQIDNQKMSKSLKNHLNLKVLLGQYSGEVLRYFLLSSHYRSPIQYTERNLSMMQTAIQRLYIALRDLNPEKLNNPAEENPEHSKPYLERFHEAMNDDFNTPCALTVLFELRHEINQIRATQPSKAQQLAALLQKLGGVLGILQKNPEEVLKERIPYLETEEIEKQITLRNLARQNKDWVTADKIRDELLTKGITIEDTTEGSTWRHI